MRRLLVRAASASDVVKKVWAVLPLALRRRMIWLAGPTFTIGVSAVLLNDQDEILLLRHWFRERQGWELPGGIVERGETLEEAIKRELREETGYEAGVLSMLSAAIGPSLHVDVAFLARVTDGSLVINSDEIAEGRFFPYEVVQSMISPARIHTIDIGIERARHGKPFHP